MAGFEQAAADARVLFGGHGEADGVDSFRAERSRCRAEPACRIRRRFSARARHSSPRSRRVRRLRVRATRARDCGRTRRRRRRRREWVVRSRFAFLSAAALAGAAIRARTPGWRCRLRRRRRSARRARRAACGRASIASAVAFERRITSIVFDADDGNVEAHVLPRLAHLHDDKPLAAGDARGALDGFVGAFHGFDGHAGAIANHDGLAQVEAGDLPRDLVGRSRCPRIRSSSGARRVSTPGVGSSGPRNSVESTSSMPSSSSTRATAPISESVFFDGAKKATSPAASPAEWS